MKLLERTKSKTTKDKNGEYVSTRFKSLVYVCS